MLKGRQRLEIQQCPWKQQGKDNNRLRKSDFYHQTVGKYGTRTSYLNLIALAKV